jgi:aminotransferase
MALLNPGDEVLLFEPFYGYHVSTLKSMRVNPVLVPLAEPDFALDTDALQGRHHPSHPRHRLNTPANPSGKVFTLPSSNPSPPFAASTTSSSSPTRSTSTSSTTAPSHLPRHAVPGMRERTIVLSGFSRLSR